MIKIEDYSFQFNRIDKVLLDCFVVDKDNVSFGVRISSHTQPPNEWVFNLFQNHFKQFFIESKIEDKKELTKDVYSVIVKKDEKTIPNTI